MAQPRRSPTDNAFMMDWENAILGDWDARNGIPKGPCRYENAEWAALVQQHVYPHHSDVTWEQYMKWVMDGGGDEWFQEKTLYCTKHEQGPLDVWYDCDACVQEVREGPMPQDRRYIWVPLSSING